MNLVSAFDDCSLQKRVALEKVPIDCHIPHFSPLYNMIVPHADIIPSLPMLVIGEKQYGGTTAMKFNQNDEFCSGELIFDVPAEEINTAALNVGGVDAVAQTMSLSVSHALKKVE